MRYIIVAQVSQVMFGTQPGPQPAIQLYCRGAAHVRQVLQLFTPPGINLPGVRPLRRLLVNGPLLWFNPQVGTVFHTVYPVTQTPACRVVPYAGSFLHVVKENLPLPGLPPPAFPSPVDRSDPYPAFTQAAAFGNPVG